MFVRSIRERLHENDPNYSLRKVAARVGVQHSYLSRIEQGSANSYTRIFLDRLAEVLMVDRDLLFATSGMLSEEIASKIIGDPTKFCNMIHSYNSTTPSITTGNFHKVFDLPLGLVEIGASTTQSIVEMLVSLGWIVATAGRDRIRHVLQTHPESLYFDIPTETGFASNGDTKTLRFIKCKDDDDKRYYKIYASNYYDTSFTRYVFEMRELFFNEISVPLSIIDVFGNIIKTNTAYHDAIGLDPELYNYLGLNAIIYPDGDSSVQMMTDLNSHFLWKGQLTILMKERAYKLDVSIIKFIISTELSHSYLVVYKSIIEV